MIVLTEEGKVDIVYLPQNIFPGSKFESFRKKISKSSRSSTGSQRYQSYKRAVHSSGSNAGWL